MKRATAFIALSASVAIAAAAFSSPLYGQAAQVPGQGRGAQGPPARPKPRAGHPSGKLIVSGDIALFVGVGQPDNCILTNRFKRGQRIGFRLMAFDGGTGEPENTATLTVHLKDDHMQYAITWFGLAFAVMIAFGVWWRGQRRG